MKISELMSAGAVCIQPDDSIASAARLLSRRNVGSLPVTDSEGRLCGIVTDRDIVLRCVAAGRDPDTTSVEEIMTRRVVSVSADEPADAAAALMSREQVRRLPVVENGRVSGMLSLSDIARRRSFYMEAALALADISSNVSRGSPASGGRTSKTGGKL